MHEIEISSICDVITTQQRTYKKMRRDNWCWIHHLDQKTAQVSLVRLHPPPLSPQDFFFLLLLVPVDSKVTSTKECKLTICGKAINDGIVGPAHHAIRRRWCVCVCVLCNLCSLEKGQVTRKHAKKSTSVCRVPSLTLFPPGTPMQCKMWGIETGDDYQTSLGHDLVVVNCNLLGNVREIVKSKINSCTVWGGRGRGVGTS